MEYTLGLSFSNHEDYEKIRDLLISFSDSQGGTYLPLNAKGHTWVLLESDFVIGDLEALSRGAE
jgi:hypothetical protein|tara:strand:- start:239 stop:430 length:192 start_codon:yes stop_codon:yes gene_type:complete